MKLENLFHFFGNRAVQQLALARQELGVDGLARQGVSEGETLRRFLDNQLRPGEFLQMSKQLGFIAAHQPLQWSKVESTGDRGES